MTRPSRQARADHIPEEMLHPRRAHPRAIELAMSAMKIAAAGNGVSFTDLVAAGFTLAELIEHAPAAERIISQGTLVAALPSVRPIAPTSSGAVL